MTNQKELQETHISLEACKVFKKGGLSRVLDLLVAAGEQSVLNNCCFKKN